MNDQQITEEIQKEMLEAVEAGYRIDFKAMGVRPLDGRFVADGPGCLMCAIGAVMLNKPYSQPLDRSISDSMAAHFERSEAWGNGFFWGSMATFAANPTPDPEYLQGWNMAHSIRAWAKANLNPRWA